MNDKIKEAEKLISTTTRTLRPLRSWSDLVNMLSLTLIVVATAVRGVFLVVLIVPTLNARTSKYRPPPSSLGPSHTRHQQTRHQDTQGREGII